MPTRTRIGLRIKRAREAKQMTQRELGDAAGVTQKTVDSWEHDRTYPRNRVGALENILNISLAEPDPFAELTDPDETGIANLPTLSVEDKRRMIEYIRELKRGRGPSAAVGG